MKTPSYTVLLTVVVLAIGLCMVVAFAQSSITEAQSHSHAFQPIIADEQLVYTPELFAFSVSGFLKTQRGSLADYTEIIDGKSWTAAEIVEYNAHFYSINPQVLITLLDLQSSVVTSPAPDPEALDYSMGYHDVDFEGLYKQVNWAAQQLFAGFYARRYQEGDKNLVFRDGTTRSADLGINAGTFAIHYVLAQTALDEQAWEMKVSRGPGSVFEKFIQLFGDPLEKLGIELLAPTGILGARLPWTSGETWYYTGGPHNYTGGTPSCTSGPGCPRPWSSVDYAAAEVVSCSPGSTSYLNNRWIVAARSGNVVYSGQALVKIDHGDGWVSFYSHVSSIDRVGTGSISKGDRVGHPSCEVEPGGSTSGIHLHFATAYNGVFQDISGTSLSGWTIAETTHYNGTMTCGDGRTRTASTSRSGNDIADNCGAAVDVALIIDSSGSMTDNDPQDRRKAAAKVFIGAMQDEDQVTVIDFDEDVRVAWSLQRVGSDRSGPMAAVDTIDSSGNTNIRAALQAGFDQLNSSTVGNPKAAVFLTDGDDTVGNSDADILNVTARYAAEGWRIFTIGLIGSGDVNEALLQQIANNTGGQYFRLTDPQQLASVYFEILGTVAGGTTILDETTSLQPGETRTFLATLPPDQTTANFLTSWQGSTVDTTLTDPNGRVITPPVADQDPNIDHYKGLTFELYRVTNPQPGNWQIQIYGADIPAGGEEVTIQVAVRGPGTIPTTGGQILFTSGTSWDQPHDIYVMNEDGTNVRRLTNGPGSNIDGRFSPDGSKIVFASNRTGDWYIYTMNADGTNVQQLAPAGSWAAPDWSPDGRLIAYACRPGGICVMNADGTNIRHLTSTDDTHARWSRDGSRIVFQSHRDGNHEIYVMSADGSNQTNLTRNSSTQDWIPDWSPDGSKIAFTRWTEAYQDYIYVMNSDGTGIHPITGNQHNESPVWSPDGTKIAFNSNRGGPLRNVYVMNADGSNPTRLTNRDDWPTDWWAPSGTEVIATISVGSSPHGVGVNPTTNRIYVANSGSNTVSVIDGVTNRVFATVPVGSGPSYQIAVNPNINRIYTPNNGSSSLSVIDGAMNTVIATITGLATAPEGVGVHPGRNLIYVTHGGNKLSVIDGTTNNISTAIDTGNYNHAVAINPDTDRAYVSRSAPNLVAVINLATNQKITDINVVGHPVVNPTTNRVYLAHFTDPVVSVIDGATNNLVTTINLERKPILGAVNQNSNCVYVTHPDNDMVSIINGATNAVVGTVTVGRRPVGIAVNPTTGLIYVANRDSNTVSVIRDTLCGRGTTYSISGQVTDDTGAPVGGATVSASGPASVSAATGSDGTYTLSNLPAGTYSVSASKTGYTTPTARSVTVPPNASNVDFVLQRPTQAVAIVIFPSSKAVTVGEIFTLDIKISAGSQPVDSVDSYLSFDRNYLRVVDANGNETNSIIPGTTLPVVLQNSANNSQGRITYSAGKQLGGISPSGDFVLATIRLKAVAAVGGGGTNVNFLSGTDVFYQGRSVLGSTSNGNVQIREAISLKGRVTLQGRGSPPSDRWNNFPLAITLYSPGGTSPVGNYTTNTDPSGYFTMTGITQGTYDVKVKNAHTLSNKKTNVSVPTGPTAVDFGTSLEGDANNDDNVSGADYSILATAYGKCSGQSGWDSRADFNGSGCIEGADYSLLASNYGRRGPIPLAIPAVGPAEAEETTGSVVISIDPSSKSVTPGTIFTLDIKLAAGSQPVDSADSYLSFDRSYLRVVDASGNETNSIEAGTALPVVLQNSADNSEGRITYSAGRQLGGTPPSGDFVLATIRFKAITATPGEGTSIAFQPGTDVFYEGNSVLGSLANGYVTISAAQTGTPTPTPSRTPTATPTMTPTQTPTWTQTPTPSPTLTNPQNFLYLPLILKGTTTTSSTSFLPASSRGSGAARAAAMGNSPFLPAWSWPSTAPSMWRARGTVASRPSAELSLPTGAVSSSPTADWLRHPYSSARSRR